MSFAIVPIATLAGILSVAWIGWLGHLELGIHQQWLLSVPLAANSKIVLVTIQKDTPRKLNLQGQGLPLPRRYHAALIDALREAEADALVLDLLFLEESERQQDAALRKALARSQPLHVTLATKEEKSAADPESPTGWKYWFARPVVLPKPLPPNVVVASAKAFDPGRRIDGAVLLQWDEKTKQPIPHLAFSAVLGGFDVSPSDLDFDTVRQQVTAGILAWPVGQDGELHARWTQERFATREYADALKALQGGEGRSFFHDKIVIVGDITTDSQHTPLGEMPGMEAVAHVLNTLLVQATLQGTRWRIPANIVWGGILALVVVAAARTLRPILLIAGVLAALAAALLMPRFAQATWNVWVDTVGPCLAVVIATGMAAVLEGMRAGERARRFAPSHVREARPAALTEVATVLFVDLRGSTAMAEKLGPAAAREVLSELLGRLSNVIVRHGGEVERTLGDGLMAVFRERGGKRLQHHALQCVRAIKDLQHAVAPIDARLGQQHGVGASLTIGIESGVISGAVVRAVDREEWSSFGPTVNLAARLQGACGEVGQCILLGPGAWSSIHHEVPTVFLGTVQLKGIKEPMPVYTLESNFMASSEGSAE